MEGLAIAYVTCDKYSHVWDEWYEGYSNFCGVDAPAYWLGEQDPCPFLGFEQIYHDRVGPEMWTAKLRAQLEQIPEDNVFVWLDDLIPQCSIDVEFQKLYSWFLEHDADALRIMSRNSAARYNQVGVVCERPVYKLKHNSAYLVSFSPNIYKKDFLLEVLSVDESPWDAELKGTERLRGTLRGIYAYHIDGWCINRVVQ